MSENVQLPLKKVWFEKTKELLKKEDYRELNKYWCSRLMNKTPLSVNYYLGGYVDEEVIIDVIKKVGFRKFKTNTLTLGYPKATDYEKFLKFEHAGLEIRTGNPEWGAIPNKKYFVIKHGKRLPI